MPATRAHVEALLLDVHPEDVRELQASSGSTPREALEFGLAHSQMAHAAMIGETVLGVFGVVPDVLLGAGVGVPWAIAAGAIERHRIALGRASRVFFPMWRRQIDLPVLYNVVDERKSRAMRWLHWLGFKLGEPQRQGIHGENFVPFYEGADHV